MLWVTLHGRSGGEGFETGPIAVEEGSDVRFPQQACNFTAERIHVWLDPNCSTLLRTILLFQIVDVSTGDSVNVNVAGLEELHEIVDTVSKVSTTLEEAPVNVGSRTLWDHLTDD